jgi:DNA-directed RNA polymerase subunit RPC12/RpoP
MELIMIILGVFYFVIIVLFLGYGHLRYRKKIKDIEANRDSTYLYYCPTCTRHFNVTYYIKELEPMDSVECPYCLNSVAAFIINENDTSRRN